MSAPRPAQDRNDPAKARRTSAPHRLRPVLPPLQEIGIDPIAARGGRDTRPAAHPAAVEPAPADPQPLSEQPRVQQPDCDRAGQWRPRRGRRPRVARRGGAGRHRHADRGADAARVAADGRSAASLTCRNGPCPTTPRDPLGSRFSTRRRRRRFTSPSVASVEKLPQTPAASIGGGRCACRLGKALSRATKRDLRDRGRRPRGRRTPSGRRATGR
jgi:hypothetical protein